MRRACGMMVPVGGCTVGMCVDIFRRDATALVVGERTAASVHPHALLVDGMPTMLTPSRVSRVQRALIAVTFDDHGIAASEQGLVDEVKRLQRAGGRSDVVGDAVNAGVALELCVRNSRRRAITAGRWRGP